MISTQWNSYHWDIERESGLEGFSAFRVIGMNRSVLLMLISRSPH